MSEVTYKFADGHAAQTNSFCNDQISNGTKSKTIVRLTHTRSTMFYNRKQWHDYFFYNKFSIRLCIHILYCHLSFLQGFLLPNVSSEHFKRLVRLVFSTNDLSTHAFVAVHKLYCTNILNQADILHRVYTCLQNFVQKKKYNFQTFLLYHVWSRQLAALASLVNLFQTHPSFALHPRRHPCRRTCCTVHWKCTLNHINCLHQKFEWHIVRHKHPPHAFYKVVKKRFFFFDHFQILFCIS